MNAGDIKIEKTLPEGVSVDAFFVTSEIAYRQLSSEAEDVSDKGTCTLGVAIEAQTEGEKSARIVYFACENVINDAATSLTSGGNLMYVRSALSWLCEKEEPTLTLDADLISGTLYIGTSSIVFWFIVLVIIIPAICIVSGCVMKYKRKHK